MDTLCTNGCDTQFLTYVDPTDDICLWVWCSHTFEWLNSCHKDQKHMTSIIYNKEKRSYEPTLGVEHHSFLH